MALSTEISSHLEKVLAVSLGRITGVCEDMDLIYGGGLVNDAGGLDKGGGEGWGMLLERGLISLLSAAFAGIKFDKNMSV